MEDDIKYDEIDARIYKEIKQYLDVLSKNTSYPSMDPLTMENFNHIKKDFRAKPVIYQITNLIEDLIDIICDYCQAEQVITSKHIKYDYGEDIIEIFHTDTTYSLFNGTWTYRRYCREKTYQWYLLLWINPQDKSFRYLTKGEGSDNERRLDNGEIC